MAAPTVTISAVEYSVYVSLADAKTYLAASPRATTWAAASDALKSQWLVEASRAIDRVAAADYKLDAIDDVPGALANGTAELAALLMDDASVLNQPNAGKNIAEVGAGSTRVRFFGPTTRTAGRFPPIVQELVGPYLAGAGVSAVGYAGGTCNESSFDDADRFDLSDAP